MKASFLLPMTLALAATTAAASYLVSRSSFLSAPAGVAIPFTYANLPPVDSSGPGGAGRSFRAFAMNSPWNPSLDQLLTGETVITSDGQMRDVWRRLFSEPYDASEFDFENEFVVLMGEPSLSNGSFYISEVEEVDASYANDGVLRGRTTSEHFLSVTATKFLPGVDPQDPPPPTPRVSAVKITRDQLDDVVFHRRVIMGI